MTAPLQWSICLSGRSPKISTETGSNINNDICTAVLFRRLRYGLHCCRHWAARVWNTTEAAWRFSVPWAVCWNGFVLLIYNLWHIWDCRRDFKAGVPKRNRMLWTNLKIRRVYFLQRGADICCIHCIPAAPEATHSFSASQLLCAALVNNSKTNQK